MRSTNPFLRALYKLAPILESISEPEEFTAEGARWKVTITASPKGEVDGSKGSPMIEEVILETIGSGVMYAKEIAEKSGYAYSSHLKDALSKLVKDGRVLKTLEGYRLP